MLYQNLPSLNPLETQSGMFLPQPGVGPAPPDGKPILPSRIGVKQDVAAQYAKQLLLQPAAGSPIAAASYGMQQLLAAIENLSKQSSVSFGLLSIVNTEQT